MGYLGCAWATLICYFSMAAISFSLGQKYYPVPYPTRRITAYLALALTAYFSSEMLQEAFELSKWLHLFVNTLIFGAYLFIAYKLEEKEAKPLFVQLKTKLIKK
jgi:hypothetical protein